MFNHESRPQTTSQLFSQHTTTQINSYRPLRRQASITQQIHHDIFYPSTIVINSPFVTGKNNESKENHHKSSTKTNYPHKTTDIFNQTPCLNQPRQGRQIGPNLSINQYKQLSPTQSQYKPKDHSKEFILHCAPTDKLTQKPQTYFVPQYREETIFQRRQRDFVNDEMTKTKSVMYESPPKLIEFHDKINRQVNPQKSDNISNIFALPDKDLINQIHILSQQQKSKSDLNPTYGKSIHHPWLQKQEGVHTTTQVNELANFEQNYAHDRKQMTLRTSTDNTSFIPTPQPVQEPEIIQLHDLYRSRSIGHTKSDLISQNLQWNQFDSILHGQHLQGQHKTEYPLPTNGIKESTQVDNHELETLQLDHDTRSTIGSVHNNFYNVKTQNIKKVDNNDVVQIEIKSQQPLFEPNLRNVCRQNGWHLVKYDFKHDCITNNGTGESKLTIRGNQSPNRQSVANLRQDLDKIGIETKETQLKVKHKDMNSQLWFQQEQQRKELQQLEIYYQEQAKSFINSGVKTQRSQPRLQSSKKSKYSHVY